MLPLFNGIDNTPVLYWSWTCSRLFSVKPIMIDIWRQYCLYYKEATSLPYSTLHMGLKHAPRGKKFAYRNFFDFRHKNVHRIRFQKIKIGPLKGFEKKGFFSLLIMRKRLSGGQNWFLKPYFPLTRGMFNFCARK